MVISGVQGWFQTGGSTTGGRLVISRGVAASLVLALCLAVFAGSARAAIYWGNLGHIGRVNLDRSFPERDFLPAGGYSICGIALTSSHIYWSDSYGSTIGRANLDGTAGLTDFIPSPGTYPCDLAVDSTYLYWPNLGDDTIGRARLDGTNVETAFIRTAPRPCGVAVDQTAIYWASEQEGQIWRTDIKGLNGPEIVIDGATDPCGVVLSNKRLFWADGNANRVGQSNLDGSDADFDFITGAHYPATLRIYGDHLYWVNVTWGFESIGRANLDGTNATQDFISPSPYAYALAVDSVNFLPKPSPPPRQKSYFTFGKVRHDKRKWATFLSIKTPEKGTLRVASTRGVRSAILPAGTPSNTLVEGGEKLWIRVWPAVRSRGGAYLRRMIRRRGGASVMISIHYVAVDRDVTVQQKEVLLKRKP
jgi:hypothetical protein